MSADGRDTASSLVPAAAVHDDFGAGGKVLGVWNLDAVRGGINGGIILQLRRTTDGARLSVEIQPRGQRRWLATTAVGDVSYLAAEGIDNREAHRTTLAIAKLLDRGALPILRLFPHLAMPATVAGDAEAEAARRAYATLLGTQLAQDRLLGHDHPAESLLPEIRRALYFDALGIAEFLAPEVEVDGAPVAGFVLRAIYPPATARRQALDYGRFVLEFEAASPGEATVPLARIQICASGSERSPFGRVGSLTLSLLGHEGDPDELPLSLSALSSWILAILRLKQGAALEVHVPTTPAEVRALSIPQGRSAPPVVTPEDTRISGSAPASAGVEVEHSGPRSLNLAIDAPCAQQCAFCSVQRYVRPTDGGADELERIRQQLRVAREQGLREVRLNGIDPLAFSRVLDVIATVAELGFPELSIYSPCRRFADAAFRHELLRRAPQQVLVTVPLYGITAETHDAVTGAPGAHAEVMRAIDGLKDDMRSGELRLSIVIVKRNLDEVLDVARYARSLGVQLDARLPYPMRQTVDDPYAEAALRETEIVARILDAARQAPAEDLAMAFRLLRDVVPHPCLLFRAEQATGLPIFPAAELREHPLLPGTEYRSQDFAHTPDAQPHGNAFAPAVVGCPHAARCSLAPVCPGEQFSVYEQIYGLDELSAVLPGELYTHAPRR
jgi:molybdenum cofactor biosynthesis enzyme MoaA